MDFGFDEQQDLLRSEVRKFLDAQCPMAEVRRLSATSMGYSPEVWKQLAELGWLGLLLPEEYGGAGLGWVDLTVLLEETGRSLFPSPLISSVLAASAIAAAGTESQKGQWLPALAAGTRIGTLAVLEESDQLSAKGIALESTREGDTLILNGEKLFVPDAGLADLFVVAFRSGDDDQDITVAVLDADQAGLTAKNTTGIDATKRTGTLVLSDVRVARSAVLGEVGSGWPLVARSLDRGAVAVTAEIIGSCQAALDLTVQYAKDRVQFGQPIGHFQGVKHPLAEAYVDIECMKSLCYYSAWALDESPDEVPACVSRAKGFASEAVTRIGITGIQLHGAVGYTEEYDIQLYLKRSKWARPAYGDECHHYERIATLGGL